MKLFNWTMTVIDFREGKQITKAEFKGSTFDTISNDLDCLFATVEGGVSQRVLWHYDLDSNTYSKGDQIKALKTIGESHVRKYVAYYVAKLSLNNGGEDAPVFKDCGTTPKDVTIKIEVQMV